MIKLNPNQMMSKFFNALTKQDNDEKSTSSKKEGQAAQVGNANSTGSVNLLKSSSASFGLFYKSVQQGVQREFAYSSQTSSTMAFYGANDIEVADIEEAELAQQNERATFAANNILGFIGRRLELDKEQGASNEALQSRLQAGLEGFEKGLAEANQILSDMGLLSEDVEADIALTEQKVRSGVEDFESLIYPSEANSPAAVSQASEVQNQDLQSSTQSIISSFAESLTSRSSGISQSDATYSSIESNQARSFQFELVTQDGDTVKIDASAFQRAYLESGPGSFSSGTASGSDFGLVIEGELDADEMKAITDLLKDVNQLASDFYSGDMSNALEKAMNIGFDSSEIGAFALNLSQVTQVKAMQAYLPNEQMLKPAVLSELKPLGKFASQLSQLLTRADEKFSHPRELLSELFEKFEDFKLNELDDDSEEDSNQRNNTELPAFSSEGAAQISLVAFSQSIIEQWSIRQSGPNEQVAAVTPGLGGEQDS